MLKWHVACNAKGEAYPVQGLELHLVKALFAVTWLLYAAYNMQYALFAVTTWLLYAAYSMQHH